MLLTILVFLSPPPPLPFSPSLPPISPQQALTDGLVAAFNDLKPTTAVLICEVLQEQVLLEFVSGKKNEEKAVSLCSLSFLSFPSFDLRLAAMSELAGVCSPSVLVRTGLHKYHLRYSFGWNLLFPLEIILRLSFAGRALDLLPKLLALISGLRKVAVEGKSSMSGLSYKTGVLRKLCTHDKW